MKIDKNTKYLGTIANPKQFLVTFVDSKVAGGFPSPAIDFQEKELDLNELIDNPNSSHIIELVGDSMAPTIPDGALLLVDCAMVPKHKDIVIASINHEFTCKRLYKTKDRFGLYGDNKDFPFIVFEGEDEVTIFGVVTTHFFRHQHVRNSRL